MDNSAQAESCSAKKKCRLGFGKTSRRYQCTLAAQKRWKKANHVDERSSLSTADDVHSTEAEHVLATSGGGDADTSRGNNNENAQPNNDQCAARRKMNFIKDHIAPTDNVSAEKERCFMEYGSLKSLMSTVACKQCGGYMEVSFGDKMGFSREIKLS